MIVMGLNAWHGDAAAVLLIDGRVVAAVEEERLRRVKHWAGFPEHAIRVCLEIGGIDIAEVDHWAINSDGSAHRWRKLAYLARGIAGPRLIRSRLANRRSRMNLGRQLSAAFDLDPACVRTHPVEHHLCHLGSAYYPSRFADAWVVSVDGLGDFASAAWARTGGATGGDLRIGGRVYFPHSLGIFYQAMTQYLGFPAYGDEYKVMGLASYGSPEMEDVLMRLVRLLPDGGFHLDTRYFRHHRESVCEPLDGGTPVFGALFSGRLEQLLGPAREPGDDITQWHRNIAASVQKVYQNALGHLLRRLHAMEPSDQLALAGGCAMNSVANGRIVQQMPFRRVYVQPAAGDAGGAMGAALIVSRHYGVIDPDPMPDAFLGPEYGNGEISRVIDGMAGPLAEAGCRVAGMDMAAVIERVVQALAQGRVVGWFQGRMEWGARALGNRSILADPRRPDIQSLLNAKIKRRESFRPFAPSIMREHVAEWFGVDDDEPYMQKVYPIKPEKRRVVPAVTHVDGTGRLQTVCRTHHPLYHRLIDRFYQLTGVPMLLNTSFNENEPIVCRPDEALACFLRTRMDILVMGEHVIWRNG